MHVGTRVTDRDRLTSIWPLTCSLTLARRGNRISSIFGSTISGKICIFTFRCFLVAPQLLKFVNLEVTVNLRRNCLLIEICLHVDEADCLQRKRILCEMHCIRDAFYLNGENTPTCTSFLMERIAGPDF